MQFTQLCRTRAHTGPAGPGALALNDFAMTSLCLNLMLSPHTDLEETALERWAVLIGNQQT